MTYTKMKEMRVLFLATRAIPGRSCWPDMDFECGFPPGENEFDGSGAHQGIQEIVVTLQQSPGLEGHA